MGTKQLEWENFIDNRNYYLGHGSSSCGYGGSRHYLRTTAVPSDIMLKVFIQDISIKNTIVKRKIV